MDAKDVGNRHGATVRKAADLGVGLVVALGKDVALNAQRGFGYVAGFAQGLFRSRDIAPNA